MIPILINTIPDDKWKLLIVIKTLRIGYRVIDPTSILHRFLQAVRIQIHYTCGLPEPEPELEPGYNVRRT